MELTRSNKRFMLVPVLPLLAMLGFVGGFSLGVLRLVVWIPRLLFGLFFGLTIFLLCFAFQKDPEGIYSGRYHSRDYWPRQILFFLDLQKWMWPWLQNPFK